MKKTMLLRIAFAIVVLCIIGVVRLQIFHKFTNASMEPSQYFKANMVTSKLDEVAEVSYTRACLDKKQYIIQPGGSIKIKLLINGTYPLNTKLTSNSGSFSLSAAIDNESWSTIYKSTATNKIWSSKNNIKLNFPKEWSDKNGTYLMLQVQSENQKGPLIIDSFVVNVGGSIPPKGFQIANTNRRTTLSILLIRPILMLWLSIGILFTGYKKFRFPLILICLGIGCYILAILLKYIFFKSTAFLLDQNEQKILMVIWMGFLTGITECGVFLLLRKILLKKISTLKDIIAIGISFAIAEIFYIGVIYLIKLISYPDFYIEAGLTSEGTAIIWMFLERISASIIHVTTIIWLFISFINRKWNWFILAFAVKSVIDMIAGAAITTALPYINIFVLRVIIILSAICMGTYLFSFHKNWRSKLLVSDF